MSDIRLPKRLFQRGNTVYYESQRDHSYKILSHYPEVIGNISTIVKIKQ